MCCLSLWTITSFFFSFHLFVLMYLVVYNYNYFTFNWSQCFTFVYTDRCMIFAFPLLVYFNYALLTSCFQPLLHIAQWSSLVTSHLNHSLMYTDHFLLFFLFPWSCVPKHVHIDHSTLFSLGFHSLRTLLPRRT